MLKKIILIGAFCTAASAANANHYGMAGCGLGSLVFEDQPGKVQIVAGILNNIVSPQTSAITSGTSGCYSDGGSAATDRYIENNQIALQEDIARGQGETLSGLLTIWKCEETGKVGSALQGSYEQIYSSSSPSAVKGALQNTIKSNKDIATTCKALI